MSYSVSIDRFEGPLDLLLRLVEAETLEITDVSLVQVTEPFVRLVRERQSQIPAEELADFLVVAAKLIYLKSKALIPEFSDAEMEEGPNLAEQLRVYQMFVEAAKILGDLDRRSLRSYGGQRRVLPRAPGFFPPPNLTVEALADAFSRVIRALQPLAALARASVGRIITIEEKIQEFTRKMQQAVSRLSFYRLLSHPHDRAEVVISFLALLELMKQRAVVARQTSLFDDIELVYDH